MVLFCSLTHHTPSSPLPFLPFLLLFSCVHLLAPAPPRLCYARKATQQSMINIVIFICRECNECRVGGSPPEGGCLRNTTASRSRAKVVGREVMDAKKKTKGEMEKKNIIASADRPPPLPPTSSVTAVCIRSPPPPQSLLATRSTHIPAPTEARHVGSRFELTIFCAVLPI